MAPSHAEIWDDSALVNSWNDALEEYKKYHSIEAKGENVDTILEQADNGAAGGNDEMKSDEAEAKPPTRSASVVEAMPSEEFTNGNKSEQSDTFHTQGQTPKPSITLSPQRPDSQQPALPQHLIGQVHDESLKNLLMSWYYAGYYTGLYEGQQQGTQTQKG